MARSKKTDPVLDAVTALTKWLRSQRLPFMVIGGLAVSILGRPRMTRDVDAVLSISNDRWEQFILSGSKYQIVPRAADCLAFAQESMVFLLQHLPSKTPIDLSVGTTDFEQQALSNRLNKRLMNQTISLPKVEDLIIMKAVAGRPIDHTDITTLLKKHANLDQLHITHWLEQFSEVLENHTLVSDYHQLVRKSQGR